MDDSLDKILKVGSVTRNDDRIEGITHYVTGLILEVTSDICELIKVRSVCAELGCEDVTLCANARLLARMILCEESLAKIP